MSGLGRFIETFDVYLLVNLKDTLDICLLIFIDALDIYLDILSGSSRFVARIFLIFIFGLFFRLCSESLIEVYILELYTLLLSRDDSLMEFVMSL